MVVNVIIGDALAKSNVAFNALTILALEFMVARAVLISI
jgi:hypothetical protein